MRPSLLPVFLAAAWISASSPAVILLGTGDLNANATAAHPPEGDYRNSGLQFQGSFGPVPFSITPIGPGHFLAADHVGFAPGVVVIFRGVQYTATGFTTIPGTDLRVWSIDPNAAPGPFPTWAPLYTRAASEVGRTVVVYGHGTQRGAAYTNGQATGWVWGPGDFVERWGLNRVRETVAQVGDLLHCTFDGTGDVFGLYEGQLSVGDSSGGLFVQEAGVWKLAGIHYAVDEYYETATSSTSYSALTDARGMWRGNVGTRTLVSGLSPVPSGFYSSRLSTFLPQILAAIGQSSAAVDTFAKWRAAVFTPEQLAAPNLAGPADDPDADGLPNLAEYAFGTGPWMRSNAPVVGQTSVAGTNYLTLTYSRAKLLTDVTYTVEASTDLQTWSSAGATVPVSTVDQGDVTQVTVRDTVPLAPGARRYLRMRLTKSP